MIKGKKWQRAALAILLLIAIMLPYVGLYFQTTSVQEPNADAAPKKARMFKGEWHLLAFYPLYLGERWVRNCSLRHADSNFNVSFENGKYDHPWLYGDGKSSQVWYCKIIPFLP